MAIAPGLRASAPAVASAVDVRSPSLPHSPFATVAPVLAPGLLTAFLTQAHALRVRLRRPSWMSARVLERDGHRCWWCEQPATGTASLFSRALGGRASVDNTATACPACAQRLADLDPIAEHWRNPSSRWTPTQAAQRQRALAETWQHARGTDETIPVRAHASLEKLRWEHPRVSLAVLHGNTHTWIAPVAKPEATWAALMRLARSLGAQRMEDTPDVWGMASPAWREGAAWQLIEEGALLHRVNVADLTDAEASPGNASGNPGDGSRWDELFQGARAASRAGKEG